MRHREKRSAVYRQHASGPLFMRAQGRCAPPKGLRGGFSGRVRRPAREAENRRISRFTPVMRKFRTLSAGEPSYINLRGRRRSQIRLPPGSEPLYFHWKLHLIEIPGHHIEFFPRRGMVNKRGIIPPERRCEPGDPSGFRWMECISGVPDRRDGGRPETLNKSTSPVEIKGFSDRRSAVGHQTIGRICREWVQKGFDFDPQRIAEVPLFQRLEEGSHTGESFLETVARDRVRAPDVPGAGGAEDASGDDRDVLLPEECLGELDVGHAGALH